MAYALLTSTSQSTSPGSPTSNIDTTSATLIVVAGGNSSSSIPGRVTDSLSNQYVCNGYPTNSSGACLALFYCVNPITSATHNFTYSGGGIGFPGCVVAVFSGDPTPFTQFVEATATGNVALPSLTPSTDNCLLVTGYSQGSSVTESIDGGFTIVLQVGGVATQRIALAYLIQTSAAAASPTWSVVGTGAGAAQLISFPLGTGGGGGGGETAYAFAG